uniref:Uncharacterized protein n=1 Tax=Neobodo designis TaxID=312471 RepID=A0A7S1Q0Z9_NEODS
MNSSVSWRNPDHDVARAMTAGSSQGGKTSCAVRTELFSEVAECFGLSVDTVYDQSTMAIRPPTGKLQHPTPEADRPRCVMCSGAAPTLKPQLTAFSSSWFDRLGGVSGTPLKIEGFDDRENWAHQRAAVSRELSRSRRRSSRQDEEDDDDTTAARSARSKKEKKALSELQEFVRGQAKQLTVEPVRRKRRAELDLLCDDDSMAAPPTRLSILDIHETPVAESQWVAVPAVPPMSSEQIDHAVNAVHDIIMDAMPDQTKAEYQLTLNSDSVREAARAVVNIILEANPRVLEGHVRAIHRYLQLRPPNAARLVTHKGAAEYRALAAAAQVPCGSQRWRLPNEEPLDV